MKFLKTPYFFIPILLLAGIVFLYFYAIAGRYQSIGLKPDTSIELVSEYNYEHFMLDKISMVDYGNGKIHFSLYADKVVHRKRVSRFFIYQNLKELNLSGVNIKFYPDNKTDAIKGGDISLPLDDIGSSLASFGKKPTEIKDYLDGNVADIDLDLMSRLLLEDLSIDIELPDDKKIIFIAKGAHINTNLDNIVFTDAKIIASNGIELSAPVMVWSKKYNGIYLPEGYALQNNYHKKEAFFVIDRQGIILKRKIPEKIKYVDYIEEAENTFYANSKTLPLYARIMLGLP